MSSKLVVWPQNKGLQTNKTAFNIEDDAFNQLINAYQWRARVKRKRGTSILGRLERFLGTTDGAGDLTVTISPSAIQAGLITVIIGTDIFVDPGTVSPVTLLTNSSGSAVLNRTTGVLTITGSLINTAVIYFPTLPVMGLEDFQPNPNVNLSTLAFDTKYSYAISNNQPYNIHDVSFYKNLATSTYTNYVQKANWTPTWWNGTTYQQFSTVNYQGALFASNVIDVPFTGSTIGLQGTQRSNPGGANYLFSATQTAATTVDFVINNNSPLVIGDFVFANEFTGTSSDTLNFQTGYVTAVAGTTYTVKFPNANIGAAGLTPGFLQYLTTRSNTSLDCLRWYDGDPTDGNPTNPTFQTGKGWVNYMPPISQANFSIGNLPAAQYYLVGCKTLLPFKDRLIFFGPVVQTSSGNAIYLQDTVLYTQNGTPYYTASFAGTVADIAGGAVTFNPLLVPVNQTAAPSAFFTDQTGFGGFITIGIDQPINSVSINEDLLVLGLSQCQVKMAYTGNDIVPFNFFFINSELGTSSTFSVINLDKGAMSKGDRGFIITSQVECQRIDLDIPDSVFEEVSTANNGNERFTAIRDFINEWVYFSYPYSQNQSLFNTQTLQFNYRDNTWAIFNESYTRYGLFRNQTGLIWSNVGDTYATWEQWNEPWNAGSSNIAQPEVIAGNTQGYIVYRDQGTTEAISYSIQDITNSIVTSPTHALQEGDFVRIFDCNGTIGQEVNAKVFKVTNPGVNTFEILPNVSGTYLGGGEFQRLYVPFIQTKQFPVAWESGRKTRIGPQRYLLSTTPNGQITLQIYLSQNASYPYSTGPIVPAVNSTNNALIYSSVLYTCPESTNLGLTPYQSNLMTPTALAQQQLWHRKNTSLIGDTVQLGFTISDEQMQALTPTGTPATITAATKATNCVLTCNNNYFSGELITITGVVGMTELNDNTYFVVSATSTTVTILVDSTAFTIYVSGGVAQPVDYNNPTAEVELHGFILDVSPSQMLV